MGSDRSQAGTVDMDTLAVALERLGGAVARLEASLLAHEGRQGACDGEPSPEATEGPTTYADADLLRTLATRLDAAIARLRFVLAE